MRRLFVTIFAMLFYFNLQAHAEKSLVLGEHRCVILALFSQVFKEGSLGRDPELKEVAAWVVQTADGKFELMFWPRSVQRNQQDWNAPIPKNMIAQVHVHTVVADPRPSQQDLTVARKFGTTIYTIHVKGIYRVTPDGEISREADPFWYKKLNQCKNLPSLSALR